MTISGSDFRIACGNKSYILYISHKGGLRLIGYYVKLEVAIKRVIRNRKNHKLPYSDLEGFINSCKECKEKLNNLL